MPRTKRNIKSVPVFKMFSVHTKNFSGLKSVFEMLRFSDGLMREVGLIVEIKVPSQPSPSECERVNNLVYVFT